jgi:hypothetical protein
VYQLQIEPATLLYEIIENRLWQLPESERDAVEAVLWQIHSDFEFQLYEFFEMD